MNKVPSPFEQPEIVFDVHQQIPPVVCHAEVIGMCGKLVLLTLQQLTPQGRSEFCKAFDNQHLPPHWDALTPPYLSSQGDKLMMGAMDIKHLIGFIK